MSKITHVNLDGGQYAMSDPRFENDKFLQYDLGAIAETSDTSQNETLQKIYDAAASGGSVAAVYNGIILEVSEVSTDKMILSSKINLTFTEVEAKITSGTVESAVSRKVTPITYGEDEPEIGVTPLPSGTIYCKWGSQQVQGLLFTSGNEFELKFAPETDATAQSHGRGPYIPDAKIEISKDGLTWTQPVWDATNGINLKADTLNPELGKYSVYIRSDNHVNDSNLSSVGDGKISIFSTISGSNIEVSGTLEALWGGKDMIPFECFYLFKMMNSLTSASKLIFPNTTTNGCYEAMFISCESLIQPPTVLPAMDLADSCYEIMFNDCTSLTSTPELPATILKPYCYNSMFNGCTALIQAPEIPAIVVAENCCLQMFNNCASLTQAPTILPATTLEHNCYAQMFSTCTSLTTTPELPATVLADECYLMMFRGCASLTKPAAFPEIEVMGEDCMTNMFFYCQGIKWASSGIPYIIKTTDGSTEQTYTDKMFRMDGGTPPEGNGTPKLNTTYYYVG